MESNSICSLFVIVLCLQFRRCHAEHCHASLYTWPLGEGNVGYEVRTNSTSSNQLKIGYNNGPTNLGYNAVEFNASERSFIEFPVLDFAAKKMEYSISFFLYVESDGVFLHYKSDDYDTSKGFIKSIKFEMVSGSVNATVVTDKGEARATLSTNVAYNEWSQLVFQRDESKQEIRFDGSYGEVEVLATGALINELDTSFPGILRFGGSMDGESYFSGRVACVQMIGCKDPKVDEDYIAECAEATLSPTADPGSALFPATPKLSVGICKQYTYNLVTQDVSFSIGDALDAVTIVDSMQACSAKCSTHGSCWSFVFKADDSCWLGPNNPIWTTETGSDLYELVPAV